jgi:hypothetical protein
VDGLRCCAFSIAARRNRSHEDPRVHIVLVFKGNSKQLEHEVLIKKTTVSLSTGAQCVETLLSLTDDTTNKERQEHLNRLKDDSRTVWRIVKAAKLPPAHEYAGQSITNTEVRPSRIRGTRADGI